MHSRFPRLLLLALFLASSACASSGRKGQRIDRSTITREQILGHGFVTALEAVEALHSNWLSVRPTTLAVGSGDNQTQKWVYMDNVRLGGIEQLRAISVSNIMSIKYFDPVAATARWGIDHGQGVIQVLTQR